MHWNLSLHCPERSTVTALMLLISCCLLLRACLAAQVGGDYEDYEYEVEVDVSKLRKNAGSRLVNARATAASEYQFVGAFFLSSSAHLKSSTCTAAMITQDVALRSIQISQISTPQRSKFDNVIWKYFSSIHCFYFEKQVPTEKCMKGPVKVRKVRDPHWLTDYFSYFFSPISPRFISGKK